MKNDVEVGELAKHLVSLGVPISPLLITAGIKSVPTEVLGELEKLVDSQLQSIKVVLDLLDRITTLHQESLSFAPPEVRDRHHRIVTAMLTGFDDSLNLSSEKV